MKGAVLCFVCVCVLVLAQLLIAPARERFFSVKFAHSKLAFLGRRVSWELALTFKVLGPLG